VPAVALFLLPFVPVVLSGGLLPFLFFPLHSFLWGGGLHQ